MSHLLDEWPIKVQMERCRQQIEAFRWLYRRLFALDMDPDTVFCIFDGSVYFKGQFRDLALEFKLVAT